MSSATYRTLLRAPGAAAFFLTAAVGRVGIAMTSLGIVWLVHARTGSYATAGLVTGGFAVAEALAGPQLARLADRLGQSRVLPPALLAHAAAVATLLALVAADSPDWLMAAGGVLAGATIPQLGALSAARWAVLLRDERAVALPAAFALESLANELAYLAGPALVSILGASGYPAAGTVLAAALVVAGGLCFAAQRRTAPPASGAAERHRAGRSLLKPGFAVLAGVNLGIGGFFGAMQISVTAFAVEHGAAGAAAALFTVSSCASLLAGWLYGLRRWRTAPRVQLAVAATGLAAGCLPLLAAGSPVELGLGVALTGLTIPVILVLCSVQAEAAVDPAVLTQAFAWLNSASAAGSAGAAAAAGWAVGTFGAHGGFAVAAMATGLMAVLAFIAGLSRGWFHRSAQKTEFVALGVGEYVPGFLAGLSHVGLSGAELEEALQFLVLAAVDRVDVEVKAKLGLLGFGAGAEDERQSWIVRIGADGADLNTAVLVRLQDDEAEHRTPEIR